MANNEAFELHCELGSTLPRFVYIMYQYTTIEGSCIDTEPLTSDANLTESVLRPAHGSLRKCPEPFTSILTRSSGANVDRQQMFERRMGFARVWSFQQLGHRCLPLLRRLFHRALQRLVEGYRVRHWTRLPHCSPHVSQVVDRHAGHDDLDTFIAKTLHCLTEFVVLIWIIAIEQAHLHDWHIERILLRIECNRKRSEDTVVETSPHAFRFDAVLIEKLQDSLCQLLVASVRILNVIVMCREAVVIVYQAYGLCGVYLDGFRIGLPVRGEDDYSLWSDVLRDLSANLLELGVCRMLDFNRESACVTQRKGGRGPGYTNNLP